MITKLGVTYNVFNGEELLEASIKSIRENVDYINVVYQEISWTGEKCSKFLVPLLESLKARGLINNIIRFSFNPSSNIDIWNESCRKKNMGIEDLKKNKCTHFMLMDADEFYNSNEFKAAKEFVIKNNITHSVCSIYDYTPSPNIRRKDARDYCVSFILKMTLFSKVIGKCNNMPCVIDPQRVTPFVPFFSSFFYLNSISMHHMTGVRYNYLNKMDNTISNISEEGKGAIKKYTEEHIRIENLDDTALLKEGFIKVEDQFNILEHLKEFRQYER